LEALIPLAPLHQPHSLAAIRTLTELNPELPQIGCFDTAFHSHQDQLFQHYALPKYWRDRGVRRYGFHGLSYEWIARVLESLHPEVARGRVVAAHLGNGASLCAMRAGKSVDTTMGMTALDGLPMGTRCGNIDPGVVLYMLRAFDLDADRVERILSYDSGLAGLSGISHDMRILLASDKPEAAFAIRFFAMMTAQHVARMATSLGGIDALVFTGGIGEQAAPVRTLILDHLRFLEPFTVLVIAANEERMIAEHCLSILKREIAK
jgi:acetate kinase